MHIRVYIEQSRTGLWSAVMMHPFYPTTILGYLTRAECKQAATARAIRAFGRAPYFVEH